MLALDRASLVQMRRDEILIKQGLRHPIRTGQCLAGWHEGTRPRTRDGDPIRTCEIYLLCPCSCHIELDELAELSGKPRVLIDNPEYHPQIRRPIEFTLIQTPGLLDVDAVVPKDVMVSAAPGIVPGALVKQFEPTPSGRFARGELEYLVKTVTDTWVIEQERYPCTTSYISEQITRVHGLTAQLGSIAGVLDKWKEIGFATVEQGPARFTGYTPESIEMGLDRMHERSKRAIKTSMAF